MQLLFFLVSLFAACLGGICGVGGGVIIKPVLDATGLMGVSAISFLSGCTVLAMSAVSFLRNRKNKGTLEFRISTPLAVGAILGGFLGKYLFDLLRQSLPENRVGAVQAGLLLLVTFGTLAYSLFQAKIKTHHVTSLLFSCLIGLLLGTMSSFLGIGGGPINLTVLLFFYSMDTKRAAANSLYIILFSQLSSLLQTLFTRSVPTVDPLVLILMVAAGILGGLIGHHIHTKVTEQAVNRLFIAFMVLLIGINLYNLARFMLV